MEKLNEIIEKIYFDIKDQVQSDWSILEKIRYIYLQLGKYLEKNTDFFLNDKLDNLRLTDEEMKKIYSENKVNYVYRGNKIQYQIICRSSSLILQGLLKKFDIDSYMVNNCGKDDEIQHWSLVAKADNDEQIFLSIASDLPFIKNGIPTECFGAIIPYFNYFTYNNKKTNVYEKILKITDKEFDNYVLIEKNNEYLIIPKANLDKIKLISDYDRIMDLSDCLSLIQNTNNDIHFISVKYDIPEGVNVKISSQQIGSFIVEYKEIDALKLAGSNNLISLDNRLEYGYMYEIQKILQMINYNNIHLFMLEENSEVFKIFNDCFHLGPNYFKRTVDISEDEVKNFKMQLRKYLATSLNLEKEFNDGKDIIDVILKRVMIDEQIVFDSNLEIRKLKNIVKKLNNYNNIQLINLVQSVLFIDKKLDTFLELKDEYEKRFNDFSNQLEYNITNGISYDESLEQQRQELVNIREKYDNSIDALSIQKFSDLLHKISFYLIKDNYISKKYRKEYVGTSYLYNKFCILFPLIFDCSYGDNINNYSTSFALQGYSEQVVIIKSFLSKMFPELNYENCSMIDKYDNKYSPTENRIRVFPMKNRDTKEYVIGIRFWAKNPNIEEEEINLIYEPSNNLLREYTLDDQATYMMVSRGISDKLAEIENIDNRCKKHN